MNRAGNFFGYNLYQNLGREAFLQGCVNDANHLRGWSQEQLGIPAGDLRLFADGQASAAEEKRRFLEAGRRLGPGGRLLWSHSSHGSNNPDPSQMDGMQELLLCYDSREADGLWDPETCITAKWIGEACRELHFLAAIDIILDCCCAPAGNQLKGLGLTYDKARFQPRQIKGLPVAPRLIQALQGEVPANVALWSACEPAQTSADSFIGGAWQGAFTAAFLASWKPGRCRSDVIFFAREWLRLNRYSQIPHLYCRNPELVFGKIEG